MKRHRIALSLLEVLFVTSLLGLFMTMVSRALVLGYRAHVVTLEKTFHYREATVVISRILREVSTCNDWIAPPLGGAPASNMDLWRNNKNSATTPPPSGVHVQYYHDAPSRELRLVDPLRASGYRVVARQVEKFTVEAQTPNVIKISVLIYGNNVPITVTGQANQT
ncbi:hypothetical protein IV102_26520 [bacterium]|nr:hypothetical protein [bacterium]